MRRQGFTLAEILITLSVIGVVAALVIPSLGSSTAVLKNKSALQKGMATLNGAIRQNYALHGWNFADRDAICVSATKDSARSSRMTVCSLVNDNVEGGTYLNAVSTESYGMPTETTYSFISADQAKAAFAGTAPTKPAHTYLLPDGSVIGFDNSSSDSCEKENFYKKAGCFGFIDVNGFLGPNEVITCMDEDEEGNAIKPATIRGPNGGLDAGIYTKECEIEKNTRADIFPIAFYDTTFVLATNAGYQYMNLKK